MKNYTKRINIWIDEDFESDIKVLKKFIENEINEKYGKVSTSDVIRFVVKDYAEEYRKFMNFASIEK